MSVPLEGLATYDTEARVCHARIMAEYRRRAQEELEHIQAFQKQQHQQCHGETTAARPSTPSSPATATPDAITSIPAFPTPPGGTGNPLAAASATPSKPTKTPRKPSRTIKSVFSRTPKKKKLEDDFSDIRRAMGPERLACPETFSSSTAGTSAGGQRPGEDSWEWYQRNVSALPPMPPCSPGATQPAARKEL